MLRTGRSLWRYRSLLLTLTSRELKARYRGSVLGFFWSLVNPLLLLVVYTFVFSTIFDPRDPNVTPYGLFLVTGLFPWIWLQTAWLEGTVALTANSGLIRKATFPAEILPMVPVLANLVHFVLAIPVIVGGFAFFTLRGEEVGGWTAFVLPVIVLLQAPLVGGLALGSAALNAHFKDVKDLLANLLTLLFFMTPILYSLERLKSFPPIHWAVAHNPITPFMRAYHQAIFRGHWPDGELWWQMALVSLVVWVAGTWLFERLSGTLAEAV